MANRPKGFGLSADLARKRDAKFDPELCEEVFMWMGEVFAHAQDDTNGRKVPQHVESMNDVHTALKDGVVLCNLVNTIQPGITKKPKETTMAFHQMENINQFLTACEKLGCKKLDLFQTVDLYEQGNIPQVINGVIALGRKAQDCGYQGPALGPKEAESNQREFTEEQLRAGEGIIGLQAGSNKGASQAGQNFGKTRAIID